MWTSLLIATCAAQLASVPPTADKAVIEPMVTVASRSEQPLRDVAGTVSIIDAERLQTLLAVDLAAALRYEPGVNVPRDAVRFGLGGVSIRGIGGNRVGLIVDDVPVANGFTIGSFSSADRGSLETAFLSRIELMRGPASTLYGSDALGGVLQARTFSAAELVAGDASGFGSRSRVIGLTPDGSSAVSTISGWQIGRFELTAGLLTRSGQQRDNNPRPGGLSSNPAERDSEAALTRLNMAFGSGHSLTLGLEHNDERIQSDLQSFVGGQAQYATTTEMLGDDELDARRYSSALRLLPGWTGVDELRLTAYRADTRTAQRTLQTREASPPRTPPTLRDRLFVYKDRTDGLAMVADGHFKLGNTRHWQVFGLDYEQSTINELRDGLERNLSNGSVTNLIIGERFPVRDFPPSTTRTLGAYWHDEIRFGERLTLIPGLRHERVRISVDADDPLFRADNPQTAVAELDDSASTIKLGARYALNPGLSLFAQYAEGFRMPPAADLNIGFTIPTFNYVAIPNPDLLPERSRGVEVGLRMLGDRYEFEAALYSNRYTNLIESRVNIGRDAQTGALVFQSLNRGQARIDGLELKASADLPLDRFRLDAGLSLSRGRDLARDVPLNSIDPARLTLGLSHTWPSERHRLELVWTAVAGKDDIDDPDDELFRAPGYASLDAYWHWRPMADWQIDVGLYNLTDRRYWNWASVAGLPADAREIDLYTEPGRSLGVGVRFDW